MKTTLNINFTDFNTNKNNEIILKLAIRGDLTDEQIITLYKLKSQGVGYVDIYSFDLDYFGNCCSEIKQLNIENVIEIDYEIKDDALLLEN